MRRKSSTAQCLFGCLAVGNRADDIFKLSSTQGLFSSDAFDDGLAFLAWLERCVEHDLAVIV